uniref:Uncharacterized protein n=1 Tax=Arundo donax TaxID=35708 RepID=A0A0A9FCI2_ARUDO
MPLQLFSTLIVTLPPLGKKCSSDPHGLKHQTNHLQR